MSLRNAMRKAAGLLVEIPDEAPSSPGVEGVDLDLPPEARLHAGANRSEPKTVEQLVREADGPNLDEIEINETQIASSNGDAVGAVVAGDKLDFAAIYRAAGLNEVGFGAEAMLETLASLPPELPLETRRATVKAMLSTIGKTTGATPETVVADASRKLAALHSFEEFMGRKTTDLTTKNEKEIAELEAQIDAKKMAMQNARAELDKVTRLCEAESDRLDDVLEFFSLDTGPSKYASPDPSHPLSSA